MALTASWTRCNANAEQSYELRIATLAPRGSTWMRVFDAWNNTLQQETKGKLKLRFYPGGTQGDERDVVRKMRIGQLDGAAVTAIGLSLIVRPVLVLQAPGHLHQLRSARQSTRHTKLGTQQTL